MWVRSPPWCWSEGGFDRGWSDVLLIVDIDSLKAIHDTHTYAKCDEALVQIAATISR